jgi:hypothetical protein
MSSASRAREVANLVVDFLARDPRFPPAPYAYFHPLQFQIEDLLDEFAREVRADTLKDVTD